MISVSGVEGQTTGEVRDATHIFQSVQPGNSDFDRSQVTYADGAASRGCLAASNTNLAQGGRYREGCPAAFWQYRAYGWLSDVCLPQFPSPLLRPRAISAVSVISIPSMETEARALIRHTEFNPAVTTDSPPQNRTSALRS